jgi:hypothetical protein
MLASEFDYPFYILEVEFTNGSRRSKMSTKVLLYKGTQLTHSHKGTKTLTLISPLRHTIIYNITISNYDCG